MNGEFVELHCLLYRYTDNEYQNENEITFTNGQFTVKPLGHSKINDIQTWLAPFFFYFFKCVFMFSFRSSTAVVEIHVNDTRQFRMKKAKNTTITWNHIDQELWLLFVNGNHKQTWSNQNQNTFSKSQKMCFDFNNTGYCGRQHCQYSHSYLSVCWC